VKGKHIRNNDVLEKKNGTAQSFLGNMGLLEEKNELLIRPGTVHWSDHPEILLVFPGSPGERKKNPKTKRDPAIKGGPVGGTKCDAGGDGKSLFCQNYHQERGVHTEERTHQTRWEWEGKGTNQKREMVF